MDSDNLKFGRGPRELTGAVDLISHYKLLPHHVFFCKRPLPLSISDTHYLHNVVGDTEIRKGERMQLDQLIEDPSFGRGTSARIQPFDKNVLLESFQLREMTPVHLPDSEKGLPTVAGKSRSESRDKDKKHKKHKDKDREHKKHKHRHKDRSKDKDKEKKKDKSSHHHTVTSAVLRQFLILKILLYPRIRKRKHDGGEDVNDIHRHNKHKSSKIDEIGAIKLAGRK